MFIISKLLLSKNLKPIYSASSLLTNKIFNFSSNSVPLIKKYTPVDDYEITGFIGKGSTSRVYQGYNILTKK